MTSAKFVHLKVLKNLRTLAAQGSKPAAKKLAEVEAFGRKQGWNE